MAADEFAKNGHREGGALRRIGKWLPPLTTPRRGRRRRRRVVDVDVDVPSDNNLRDVPEDLVVDDVGVAGPGEGPTFASGQELAQRAWAVALDILRCELPSLTYQTYLEDLKALSLDDSRILLHVASPSLGEYLERRLYWSIEKAVGKATGQALQVDFTTDTEAGSKADSCRFDPKFYKSPRGLICWEPHDTEEHRQAIAHYLFEVWQVVGVENLYEYYGAAAIQHLVEKWGWLEDPKARFASPSGFFVSELKKLVRDGSWPRPRQNLPPKKRNR